jgi:hypothetical protein
MITFLALMYLGGCQDYEIKGNDDVIDGAEEEGAPDIQVNPELIDFGRVDATVGEAAISTVTISNEGDAALQIHDISLENPADADVFSYSTIGTVLIPPGGNTSFAVTYEAYTAEERRARIIIDSNDPDEPSSPVELLAEGVAPVITVSPESYDFGTLYIGCESEMTVTIGNIGSSDLVVSDLDYVSAGDDLDFDPNRTIIGDLPVTIPPMGDAEVFVSYAPLDDYADEGFIVVSSNDPSRPEAHAYQTAGGELWGENIDVFEQPIRGATDILLVIDNSCSMAEEQSNLASNFQYFASELYTLDLDYQVAVITTDNPSFRGDIMTPETSDFEDEFAAQVMAGTGGSGDEKPSEMAYQATQPGGDAGPGSDFLREDAMLSMVFVSDEPDSSPSSWSSYLSYFESLKDDSDNLVIHAISGDWPGGCGSASATNNVYEMTVSTGGLYLSVCATDWASHLEALVEASAVDLSSFELTEWPVPESIVVRVDGINMTTGWTYNETDRAIDFDESHVPEGGSTIEVEYALFGDCEG